MKSVKAWAIIDVDGCLRVNWERVAVFPSRRNARAESYHHERVVRVEIREVPRKKARKP